MGDFSAGSLTLVNTVNLFSTDGGLSTNTDSYVPTELAVKTYVDTRINSISDVLIASGYYEPCMCDTRWAPTLKGAGKWDSMGTQFYLYDTATITGAVMIQYNDTSDSTVWGAIITSGASPYDYTYTYSGYHPWGIVEEGRSAEISVSAGHSYVNMPFTTPISASQGAYTIWLCGASANISACRWGAHDVGTSFLTGQENNGATSVWNSYLPYNSINITHSSLTPWFMLY